MRQESYLSIAITCFLHYPVWFIGAGIIIRYFVLKIYTKPSGEHTITELGDDLMKHQANKVAADSANKYEIKNQYWQVGEEDGQEYELHGGETPKGGMISWLIQSFKKETK